MDMPWKSTSESISIQESYNSIFCQFCIKVQTDLTYAESLLGTYNIMVEPKNSRHSIEQSTKAAKYVKLRISI